MASEQHATPPDDFTLMAQIAARDEGAFLAFYRRHAAVVYALCLRVLHNAADADEVFEGCLFEVWERATQFDAARGSPLTYLITLTRSRAIDRLRRSRGAGRQGPRDRGDAAAGAGSAATPLSDCLDHERAERVRAAVDQLDDGQREAIHCAFYDGLSHSQIAERLGRPLGTVKTQIRQAFIRLRELLRIVDGSE